MFKFIFISITESVCIYSYFKNKFLNILLLRSGVKTEYKCESYAAWVSHFINLYELSKYQKHFYQLT